MSNPDASRPRDTLSIVVRPSAETNDHQVCLLSYGEDLLERFSDAMIGLDPDDIEPCSLLAGEIPRVVTIGRCGCGVIGCGSVEVTIAADGGVVTWTAPGRQAGARFDAATYAGEVNRALGDFTWETPDRTAARLISQSVDRQYLARAGLRFMWASGRIAERTMTISLDLEQGAYQVLVQAPWLDETPAVIAESCLLLLREDPRTWKGIRWSRQANGIGPPKIAGPGWAPVGH
jgi:hypothetical protein